MIISTLSSSVIALTYGINVQPEQDPTIERGKKALQQLKKAAISGTYVVDFLPILKYVPSWMPGAGFKAYAKRVLPDTLAMINLPYNEGCSLIVSNPFTLHVLPNSNLVATLSRKEMEKNA